MPDIPANVFTRRALWDAAVVAYGRYFNTGIRRALLKQFVDTFSPGELARHKATLKWRDKHAGHRVDLADLIPHGSARAGPAAHEGSNVVTEFRISVAGTDDDVAELHDLYASLLDDDELQTAHKTVELGQPGRGEMGAEDIVRLIVDNPGLDTAISTCVTAWLATRKSRRLKLIIRANGSAEIQADGITRIAPEDVAQALKLAREEHRSATTG